MADTNVGRRSLDRVRRELGLDAVIVAAPANTQALTSCNIITQHLIPDRLAVVVAAERAEAFVVCSIEEADVRSVSTIPDIRSYTEFVTSPIEAAAEVVRETGAAVKRIGYEANYLVARYYDELRQAFPDAELVPADSELSRFRTRKTPDEARSIEAAFQATDAAIAAAFRGAKRGTSTRDVSTSIKQKLLDEGADDVKFVAIGAGALTLQGHPAASSDPIADGAPLRVDAGGNFGGFCSDLARSCFVGSVDDDRAEKYRRLWAALDETIAAVGPGVEAGAVYEAAQAAMRNQGLAMNQVGGSWELPHVGHGIGLELHEFPILEPNERTKLEQGMVVCVELFYTDPGVYRLHVEDAVLVEENGRRIISRASDWSEPMVVGA
jgi:Xaa-Pro aminopeptidase